MTSGRLPVLFNLTGFAVSKFSLSLQELDLIKPSPPGSDAVLFLSFLRFRVSPFSMSWFQEKIQLCNELLKTTAAKTNPNEKVKACSHMVCGETSSTAKEMTPMQVDALATIGVDDDLL